MNFKPNRFTSRVFSFNKKNGTYNQALSAVGVKINTNNNQTSISYFYYLLNY